MKDCEQDAHSHVLQCSLNPTKSYYGTPELFGQLRSKEKKEAVVVYLKRIDNIKLRMAVFESVAKNLSDLKIDLSTDDVSPNHN